MRWSHYRDGMGGATLGGRGPHCTEMWTGTKATIHTEALDQEGRDRCQGPLQDLLSFLEGLMKVRWQKGPLGIVLGQALHY